MQEIKTEHSPRQALWPQSTHHVRAHQIGV